MDACCHAATSAAWHIAYDPERAVPATAPDLRTGGPNEGWRIHRLIGHVGIDTMRCRSSRRQRKRTDHCRNLVRLLSCPPERSNRNRCSALAVGNPRTARSHTGSPPDVAGGSTSADAEPQPHPSGDRGSGCLSATTRLAAPVNLAQCDRRWDTGHRLEWPETAAQNSVAVEKILTPAFCDRLPIVGPGSGIESLRNIRRSSAESCCLADRPFGEGRNATIPVAKAARRFDWPDQQLARTETPNVI